MSSKFWSLTQIALVLISLGVIAGCDDGDASAPVATTTVKHEFPEISDDELRDMIDEELRFTFTGRRLTLRHHAAWQILHGALPFGQRFMVYNGDKPVPALDWVLGGNQMKGWTVRHGTPDLGGRRGLKMVHEPGTKAGQGHEDQWLAVISQSGYASDHPVMFQGEEYQLGDIVRQVMWDVYPGKECSWTLIGLTRYLGNEYLVDNTTWKNSDGEDWSFERLMAMEAEQDIDRSACGGTHRLIGMAMALKRYQKETGKSDKELAGGWKAAREKIHQSIVAAERYQQADGCFSTNYFRAPGKSADLSNRINRSGHTLEVLALALEEDRLDEPWVKAAVVNLCDLFRRTRELEIECGTLYHAAHGLIEYRERRFGPWTFPGDEDASAAEPAASTEETASEEAASPKVATTEE